MKKTSWNIRRVAAWAGMIGSVLFVLVFTLEGFLRPGYKPLEMYISALSLGPRGWVQVTNFILLGILLFAFSRGVAAEFPTGKASRWGLILMTTIAVLFVVSGPFVMDPAGTPQNQATVHGTIHGLAGGIIFLLMPISMFVFLRRFRADPNWQPLRVWTLALGIIEAAAVLFFTIVSKAPDLLSTFSGWIGLIQRTALVPFMIWIFIFALKFLKRSKPG
jgi:hypothetical protein